MCPNRYLVVRAQSLALIRNLFVWLYLHCALYIALCAFCGAADLCCLRKVVCAEIANLPTL